ncbi:MAG TPA: glycosyltransferase family 2 protein [Coleofasciculaceae cyanobacterium]|jgi:glycosyltransferase involved in cell wall biosynthesis
MNPLVSAIIPAYNAERFIARTLDSILNQTYKNIEVLVVDDGSSDRTAEIVKAIAKKDSRIILLQQPNSGVAKARNLAIAKAKGEYIAPIDADDIWYPQKIEKQVEVFSYSEASVGLVYTWSVQIDEEDRIENCCNSLDSFYLLKAISVEGQVYLPLIYRNFLGNASVPLIHRSCFRKVGNYNERLKQQDAQGCEDWDLYLRIAEFYQFKVVPKFLVGYRQLFNSMSNNYLKMAKSYNSVMTDVRLKYPNIPKHIYCWSKSNFYNYLLEKSCKTQEYATTMYLLSEIIKTDIQMLLKLGVYKNFILLNLEKKLPNLIIAKIKNRLYKFKNKKTFMPKNRVLNYLEKIEIQIIRSQPRGFISPYKKILKYRWNGVLKLNKLENSWHRNLN